jgi:hypothetical protein
MATYGLWDPPSRPLDVEPWQIDLVANELEKLKPGTTAKIGRDQIREAIASQHLSFPKYAFSIHRSTLSFIHSNLINREYFMRHKRVRRYFFGPRELGAIFRRKTHCLLRVCPSRRDPSACASSSEFTTRFDRIKFFDSHLIVSDSSMDEFFHSRRSRPAPTSRSLFCFLLFLAHTQRDAAQGCAEIFARSSLLISRICKPVSFRIFTQIKILWTALPSSFSATFFPFAKHFFAFRRRPKKFCSPRVEIFLPFTVVHSQGMN